ncbi:hypothetical protein [Sphaerotilus sp.]|uniref:hypothetical protein n=1 Tax=Sphaerotilus sp. TaxID=2093942 RepID=UPI00286DCBD0|nr:hypothetical protein [Sphaerotilus sp.]
MLDTIVSELYCSFNGAWLVAHAVWQAHRDQLNATIHWQFTTDTARVKLRQLYPSIEV